jgi:ABC-type glycerol-3-phosphate transport system substrate-binding protein
VIRAGFLPMEPDWYIELTAWWFGGDMFDAKTQKFTLDRPENLRAFEWIRSYTVKLGTPVMMELRNNKKQFDSPQNPFMARTVAMEQQGPWMANFIWTLTHTEPWTPTMSELKVPRAREFELPNRLDNYEWAAAPFPSVAKRDATGRPTGEPLLKDVTYCDFDTLSIPRGAKHRKEAFEFIAYVNRQAVMEKLCMLHCKGTPLRKVSEYFMTRHPNPYIDVFETLASSPNARSLPKVPIWPEVAEELINESQAVYMLEKSPEEAVRDAQSRCQAKYDAYLDAQRRRSSGTGF